MILLDLIAPLGKKLDTNQADVRAFFNAHSKDYKVKYDKKNVFYEYFFYERLASATEGLPLDKKTILDVGAGTGPLYTYLLQKGVNLPNYYATDISEDMLGQSDIPEEKCFVGDLESVSIDKSFDYVFMLGVTTYMNEATIGKVFEKIQHLLKPGGQLVVTFTNRKSLDIRLRSFLKPLAKLFSRKDTILNQGFETWYYSEAEVGELLPRNMKAKRKIGLNHTFFPFSRLLPGLSVSLAKKIHGIKWSAFSSDLLFFFTKEK